MATSAYFSVQLPETLTDEQFARVFEWAKQNCLESNVIRQSDGGMLPLAQRSEERDLRNRQRLMLTNYRNWSIDTSKQPKGWLKLLTEDEFRVMLSERNERSIQEEALAQDQCSDDADKTAELTSTKKPAALLSCGAELLGHSGQPLGLRLPMNLLTSRGVALKTH